MVSNKYELIKYISKDIGIELEYPSNLSIAFESILLADEVTDKTGAIIIDDFLFIRTKQNSAKYKNDMLTEYNLVQILPDDPLNEIIIDRVEVNFKKYINNKLDLINHSNSTKATVYFAELKAVDFEVRLVEEKDLEDGKSDISQINIQRISTAVEILKTIKFLD